jgi:hypothetical protein
MPILYIYLAIMLYLDIYIQSTIQVANCGTFDQPTVVNFWKYSVHNMAIWGWYLAINSSDLAITSKL